MDTPARSPVSITLITMPFVAPNLTSIGLTQLKDVTRRRLGDRVKVRILYLNHDFTRYVNSGEKVVFGGAELRLSDVFASDQLHTTGLGDWFFRQVAFPNVPDNSKEYFTRYFPGRTPQMDHFRSTILERRQGLESFMDSLIERYGILDSEIVAFTSMFQQNAASFALARRLKRRRPELTIAMGGANCESPMGESLARNVDCIDYVFSGPGLKSFPDFLERYLANDKKGMFAIKGLFSKEMSSRDRESSIGEELDINADVSLDYSDFFESRSNDFDGPTWPPALVSFETSRGCWWGERAHCTFCGLNGTTMEYRAMMPDKAVNLIQGVLDRYSQRTNEFMCVDNILPMNYLKDVLPKINPPADARILYEVKANLTDEDVRVLVTAGVKRLQPGIESLATSTLRLMQKGSSSFVNIRVLKASAKYHATVQWNILVGFPREGEDVYAKYVKDLQRLTHLYPPNGAFPVRFDRYSPYFTKAEEFGLKLKYLDYYALTFPFDKDSLTQMAYHFEDTNYSAPYIASMVKWIGRIREKTDAWRIRWGGAGHAGQPKLYLTRENDRGIVNDTRSNRAVKHELSANQVRLLEFIDNSQSFDSVRKEFGPDVDRDLEYLDERELTWAEGDRLMGLVILNEY